MKSSRVYLPSKANHATVFSFLCARFPHVLIEQWIDRINAGEVCFLNGETITPQTAYQENVHVSYYKSVKNERVIPFQEQIVYEDERILVACKPHFLAVLPAGRFIKESLLNRLQEQTENPNLSPVHRIDRATAGLVLFCKQPHYRGLYQNLFKNRRVLKSYLAVCDIPSTPTLAIHQNHLWKHNIIKAKDPWFTMAIHTQSQNTNAETWVRLEDQKADHATLHLQPITGKKHQLRVQLAHMGYPIRNDRYYPSLQPEAPDNFEEPLQLLAFQLAFTDPVTQVPLQFSSTRKLKYNYV